jgi:hypothetical protein
LIGRDALACTRVELCIATAMTGAAVLSLDHRIVTAVLHDATVQASTRAAPLRLSFHLYNDRHDAGAAAAKASPPRGAMVSVAI